MRVVSDLGRFATQHGDFRRWLLLGHDIVVPGLQTLTAGLLLVVNLTCDAQGAARIWPPTFS